MPNNNTPTPEDRRQTVAVILVAYITAQGALAILKMTGTITWSWAAVLVPSYIVAGLAIFVVVLGTVLGIRDYKRARAFKRATDEMRQDVRIPVDEILKSLAEEEDEEEIDE